VRFETSDERAQGGAAAVIVGIDITGEIDELYGVEQLLNVIEDGDASVEAEVQIGQVAVVSRG
jgi:hypothetical protein